MSARAVVVPIACVPSKRNTEKRAPFVASAHIKDETIFKRKESRTGYEPQSDLGKPRARKSKI